MPNFLQYMRAMRYLTFCACDRPRWLHRRHVQTLRIASLSDLQGRMGQTLHLRPLSRRKARWRCDAGRWTVTRPERQVSHCPHVLQEIGHALHQFLFANAQRARICHPAHQGPHARSLIYFTGKGDAIYCACGGRSGALMIMSCRRLCSVPSREPKLFGFKILPFSFLFLIHFKQECLLSLIYNSRMYRP